MLDFDIHFELTGFEQKEREQGLFMSLLP